MPDRKERHLRSTCPRRSGEAFFLLLFVAILVIGPVTHAEESRFAPPVAARAAAAEATEYGLQDFVAYWVGAKLLVEGKNPYDLDEIDRIRGAQGISFGARDLWNPPWTFLLVAPLQALPLHHAANIWLGMNVLALFAAGVIALRLIPGPLPSKRRSLIILLLAYLLCAPARQALWYGQLTLVLTFFYLLAVGAFALGLDMLAGAALFALTPKPHLFYLVFVTVFAMSVKRRSFRVWSGFGLSALVMAATVSLLNPSALAVWLFGARRPMHLYSATLASTLRVAVDYFAGGFPDWPLYAVPLLGTAVWLFILSKRQWQLNWRKDGVLLLALSLATAPYGWFFDFAPLVIGNVFLIQSALEQPLRRKCLIFASLLVLFLCAALPPLFTYLTHDTFFWYPWAFLVLWVWGMKSSSHAYIQPAPALKRPRS